MLTRQHKDEIASLTADVVAEYELALLNIIAKQLMSIEDLTPYEIAVKGLELRRDANRAYTESAPMVSEVTSQALSDAYLLNALTEAI